VLKFVHDDEDFSQLLRSAATRAGVSPGLAEKDYWVTHALWCLQQQGFALWFKGGTSLSKGFSLIQRFSEDLDLKIEPGTVRAVPPVTSWTSTGKQRTAERAAYFDALASNITVHGANVTEDVGRRDPAQRSAEFRVAYPGAHLADLGASMRPFVLLEVGSARVTPHVERDLSSFVHDELARLGQLASFIDNRPGRLRCVHPYVTLLEKLDALQRRVPREDVEPAVFVRHFEDAAQIVLAEESLPPLEEHADVGELAAAMLRERQIARMPSATDEAFVLPPGPRRDAIAAEHAVIAPMFWGPRIGLSEACDALRAWIAARLARG
jgi:hypothetical protein